MQVLVTGATGFVGSAVVRLLLARGERVRVLARAGSDRGNIADLAVEVAIGDLRDEASLRQAMAGCEALYHVAADYRIWAPRVAELYEVNVEGTERLMRVAAEAGVGRIVYTSSVATLGVPPGGRPGGRGHAGRTGRHDRPLQALQVPGRGGGCGACIARRDFPW